MHRLDRPARCDESLCQPVEQFQIDWPVAEPAKVVGRTHQALAEMPEPEAIDHHPGGQGVVGPGQPFGQFEPAAPGRVERRLVFTGQNPGEPSRHFLAQSQMIATNVNAQVRDRPGPRHSSPREPAGPASETRPVTSRNLAELFLEVSALPGCKLLDLGFAAGNFFLVSFELLAIVVVRRAPARSTSRRPCGSASPSST